MFVSDFVRGLEESFQDVLFDYCTTDITPSLSLMTVMKHRAAF
jgi:hypothetical protein